MFLSSLSSLSPWQEVKKKKGQPDEQRTVYVELLRVRGRAQAWGNSPQTYHPGIRSFAVPEPLAEHTTEEEWRSKVERFNAALNGYYVWRSNLAGWGRICFFTPLVIFTPMCHEQGFCCWENKMRREAREVLQPICEELSRDSK